MFTFLSKKLVQIKCPKGTDFNPSLSESHLLNYLIRKMRFNQNHVQKSSASFYPEWAPTTDGYSCCLFRGVTNMNAGEERPMRTNCLWSFLGTSNFHHIKTVSNEREIIFLGVQGSEYALAHPVFDIPLTLLVLKNIL